MRSKKKPEVSGRTTQYGFEWGAAIVERHISHNGTVVIGLKTPRAELQIQVTKSGLVKVYNHKTGKKLEEQP